MNFLHFMKTWFGIPILVLILTGCTFWGEERTKTFNAQDVTEENTLSYGSVFVKVNPDLKYMNVSGSIKVEIQGKSSGPTKREFHIFTRPGLENMVLIETHTRNLFHPFQQPQDLMKDMKTIQKGRKPIDGKIWDVYVRALPEFPEQILSAARQKGVAVKQYRCGLEIGARRLINSQNRIYVSYIKGLDDCQGLPLNDSVLNDQQMQMIREFANQFDANITISDRSGG
jgi:hypothetical protein